MPGSKPIDLVGRTFGKWTVISVSDIYKNGQYRWNCKCECGNEGIVFSSNLIRNISTSCGCYGRQIIGKKTITHGQAHKTRIYDIWTGIRKRCTNPNCKAYKDYGGRGIKICGRWQKFENFYEDMKEGYADDLSLDRFPDINGDYSPQNCRWANSKEQNNNKRNSRFIELDGEILTITQWASLSGVHHTTIGARLKSAWPIKKAIFTPTGRTISIEKYLIV